MNSGGYGERDPPVPIPNTDVKPFSADGTWLETARESRSLPDSKKNKTPHVWDLFSLGSGNDLLSRAVSSQVPSALKGLTSVFGMGTGGTLSP